MLLTLSDFTSESKDCVWKIQGVPSKCACGNVNSIYHALDCKLGGYVSMRHNAIRDTAAFFLREAKCKDVRIEPALLTDQLLHINKPSKIHTKK